MRGSKLKVDIFTTFATLGIGKMVEVSAKAARIAWGWRLYLNFKASIPSYISDYGSEYHGPTGGRASIG